MKKAVRIASIVTASLLMLVSFVFAVLECTLILTLDHVLYENASLALVQLILRAALPIASFTLALFTLILPKRDFVAESVILVVGSAAASPFINNGFGYYFLIISALFLIPRLINAYLPSERESDLTDSQA